MLRSTATLACCAALLTFAPASKAQGLDQITPVLAKQCAVWAAATGVSAESQGDAETAAVFAGITQYFVGLYEGLSRRGIEQIRDEAALREVESDMPRFDATCGPLTQGYGERMNTWGSVLSMFNETPGPDKR